jgi:hypothetical protein
VADLLHDGGRPHHFLSSRPDVEHARLFPLAVPPISPAELGCDFVVDGFDGVSSGEFPQLLRVADLCLAIGSRGKTSVWMRIPALSDALGSSATHSPGSTVGSWLVPDHIQIADGSQMS